MRSDVKLISAGVTSKGSRHLCLSSYRGPSSGGLLELHPGWLRLYVRWRPRLARTAALPAEASPYLTRAGEPKALALAGTSQLTKEFAPMIALSPIVTPI